MHVARGRNMYRLWAACASRADKVVRWFGKQLWSAVVERPSALIAVLTGARARENLAFIMAVARLSELNEDGVPDLPARIGGIHTLGEIARASRRNVAPVIETLTAYVRASAPWPPRDGTGVHTVAAGERHVPLLSDPVRSRIGGGRARRLKKGRNRWTVRSRADVQKALEVLGSIGHERQVTPDLSRTDLRGARLSGLSFPRFHFNYSNLDGAVAREADFRGARFTKAMMRGVDLWRANLSHANLYEAHMQGARLGSADLTGAQLSKANLGNADLYGAVFAGASLNGTDLSNAKGVTRQQLEKANVTRSTRLPACYLPDIPWQDPR